MYLCSRWAMDASNLALADTKTAVLWSDDAAPWRPPTTRDRRGLGSSDGAAQRWGALAGDAGAEMGGRDGRSWRNRGGRAARGARRLPELWTRRDWESTGVGWGLPPAGAVGAVVWGLHRAPAGAAGRRRRSELHAFFISTGTFF